MTKSKKKRDEFAPVMFPLADLKLDPGNARRHDERNLAAITQSLHQFGWRGIIVVRRKDKVVLAGNGRVVAARKLGWSQAPVLFVDDTNAEAMLFALADNRTAELASWDEDRLAEILQALGEDGVDTSTLWSKPEVEALLEHVAEPVVPPATVDEDLEKPKKPKTKRGDLLVLGNHRVLCGDSTRAKDVTQLLGGAAPQMMVTDPPYGVEYDASWRNQMGLSSSAQVGKVANDDRASWAAAWHHFPGAIAYVWHSGLYADTVTRSLEAVGFEQRAQIIWVKSRFAISRGAYHWRHEPCCYAVRKGAKANWSGGHKQDTVWADVLDQVSGDDQKHALFASQVTRESVYAFGASSTTVWEMPNDAPVGGGHSTQKPVEAMARPMRNHKVESVYDPFLGTGTTLVAAEQEGRRCYGLEIDPAYCDVIVRRWEALTGLKVQRNPK